jgi:predicted Fe-Mo cluster-binding NifX family protein
MKIAIPVNDDSDKTSVCQSLGRTPFFLIHDTETGESRFVDNSAANVPGGAGIQAAQLVADSGAEALLTPRCGGNAADVLKAAGIKIYKTVNASIRDNIDAFKADELALLQDIHPGLHGHGGR